MNVKKFMAGAVASVMAVSAMAVAANAYDGLIKYADSSWSFNTMGDDFTPPTIVVDKDGTYTVKSGTPMWTDEETGSEEPAVSGDALVFCVDISDLAADKNAGKGADGYDDCKTGADKMAFAKAAGIEVSDVKVSVTKSDGSTADVAVDQSKIIFGDIEGNGKIRIEIYNEYGDTKNDAPVNVAEFADATEIAVTFTISGIDGDDAAATNDGEDDNNTGDAASDDNGSTTTPTDDKQNADTGIEGVAVVAGLAIVAAGAVVVAKKRK